MTLTRTEGDRFTVEVANSPFAEGFGPSDHPVCFPIKGMLSAMGELTLGRAVAVEETSCAAVSGDCCRFQIAAVKDSFQLPNGAES